MEIQKLSMELTGIKEHSAGKFIVCPHCNGTGNPPQEAEFLYSCIHCHGTGKLVEGRDPVVLRAKAVKKSAEIATLGIVTLLQILS